MKHIDFIVWALVFLPLALGAQTIRHISITGNERTQTHIIARELLFAAGDSLDHALVAETERNLRLLPYLGNADIAVTAAGNQVDIRIRVSDLYSRALAPVLSGSIDELSYGLVGLDYNVAGRGQSLRLALENRAISGRRGELNYDHHRVRGSRQDLGFNAVLADEGHGGTLVLQRRFATLESRQSYSISAGESRTIARLYTNRQLTARYRIASRSARLWYSRSYGGASKIRPSIEMRYIESNYAPLGIYTYAPMDRHRVQMTLGILAWKPRYEKSRFVHNLGPTEDLQTGGWLSLRSGIAVPIAGNDRPFALYSIQLSPRWVPRPHTYVFSTFFASSQHDYNAFSNTYLSAQTRIYTRIGATHSLALRARWDLLHAPEDGAQLLLGLTSGLRSYDSYRFDGQRRFVFNAEFRPSFVRSFWYTLAGALFLDAGSAWTKGANSPPLRYGPGLGLRLGLPRIYGTPVWRLDLAYAPAEGSSRLSVGMGQYF